MLVAGVFRHLTDREVITSLQVLLLAFGGTNAVNTAPIQGQPQNLAADSAKLLFISLCFGMSLAVKCLSILPYQRWSLQSCGKQLFLLPIEANRSEDRGAQSRSRVEVMT